MWIFRRMNSNEEVLRRMNGESEIIRNIRKTSYLGHIMRKGKYRIHQTILQAKIEERRPRERRKQHV